MLKLGEIGDGISTVLGADIMPGPGTLTVLKAAAIVGTIGLIGLGIKKLAQGVLGSNH